MECARGMIRAEGFDLEFWAEVVKTVVYITNWCLTKALDSKTPQEAWISGKPDVFHLKVFDCKTYVHIPNEKKRKIEYKSIVFIVFSGQKQSSFVNCYKP
jgi:hypothetical protein